MDISSPLPEPWNSRLKSFERLLLIRVLQPRVLPQAAKSFVLQVLGPECASPTPSDLEEIFQQSSCRIPIMLVLSPGYHPLPKLIQFADRKRKRLVQLSMGRGQGTAAEKLVKSFLTQPRWVVLENCHLAGDWMVKLKSLVDSLPAMGAHPEFRLWLTAAVTRDFPLSILQASLKVSDGLAEGLRSNLTATLQQLSSESRQIMARSTDDDPVLTIALGQTIQQNGTLGFIGAKFMPPGLDTSDPYQLKSNAFQHQMPLRRLFLYLCFLHAVLQERRHYGQLGWSVPYDFGTADLDVSIRQLLRMKQETQGAGALDLPRLIYLMSESFYGGRIIDVHDRRLLRALLEAVLDRATDPVRPDVDDEDGPAAGDGKAAPAAGGRLVVNPAAKAAQLLDMLQEASASKAVERAKYLPPSAVIFSDHLPALNCDVSFNHLLMLVDKMPDISEGESTRKCPCLPAQA